MISYVSREPMNLAEVIVALSEWKPFEKHDSKGLTNGTSYAHGGEFIASDGKVHVGFDFFQLSRPASRQGAEEFQKQLDLVSDCSNGADLDLFHALVSDPEEELGLSSEKEALPRGACGKPVA